jgi:hypothetical protein
MKLRRKTMIRAEDKFGKKAKLEHIEDAKIYASSQIKQGDEFAINTRAELYKALTQR